MLKKLLSHTAIYGLAPQIPKIASVFSLPIITPYLTKTDFGVFGLITAVVGSISVFATLGLNIILTNSYYKSPGQYKWVWRQIYGFLTLWNIPFAFILGSLIFFFIPQEAANNTWYIILLNVLPIVFFGPTSILGNFYYQLKQRPTQIAIRAAIFGLISVSLNIYFIAVLKMGYMGWFLAICIASILSHASYWIPINLKLGLKPIFNFKWRLIKQSLRIGLPTLPHSYSSYLIDASDRVVMKLMDVSTGNIGMYNVAYTVGNIVQQGGIAAGRAVSPMLYNAYKDKKEKEARNLIFTLQATFLTLTFIFSIWLKEVFILLIKNKSLQSVYPLGVIIVMAYNYRPMYLGAVSRLFYEEKTKALLRISFIAGITNLVLNFIFIPLLGYKVAAYTTFLSLMYMGYSGYLIKEYKGLSKVYYYPFIWLIITLILSILAYFAVEFSVIWKVIMCITVLMAVVIFIKRINVYNNET